MGYKHLFFDLDHTLWDFERNCTETLHEIYHVYGIDRMNGFSVQEFINTYLQINDELWGRYDKGELSKETVRNQRFEEVFSRLGLSHEPVPQGVEKFFLENCPMKPHLMPYARQVLEQVARDYELHIITNGFADTQGTKMTSAGIEHYFREVVHSETCGHKKPDERIFHYTVEKVGANAEECLMIGDNINTDIKGARNAGIDHVFFNPAKVAHREPVTHEVHCLSELLKIL